MPHSCPIVPSLPENVSEPLHPRVLAMAAVPLEDAVWLHGSKSGTMMSRLSTERGQNILQLVRGHLGANRPQAANA